MEAPVQAGRQVILVRICKDFLFLTAKFWLSIVHSCTCLTSCLYSGPYTHPAHSTITMSSSITCPGDGCPEFYHYNFNNSTNPLPPPVTPLVTAICWTMVAISCLGVLICLLLWLCISNLPTTPNSKMARRIQKIQCIFDLLTCLVWVTTVSINLHYGRVPSNFFCQFGGVVLHFFATGNFTTITYGVYNR